MSNFLRNGKRVVAATLAVSTAAMTVGSAVLAPLAARAATIASGSLIKGSLPAVYYYGADGKRYVFPNEKTFKTWYADFSSVQTISDAELASIMIGGNVTYRPGVKMIKIISDARTYAVAKKGTLRWVKTEAAASGLYGSTWNQKIDDISDAFFTNYTIGADINVASDFNLAGELAAATSINADKDLGVSQQAAVVTASVSMKSPSSMSLPSGAFYAPVLVLSLKNNSNQEVKLGGMKVQRTGITADSNVTGLLVTDGNGLLKGSLVTFGQSVAMPGFGNDPIRIPAMGTAEVALNVNLATGNYSGTVGASIVAPADLMVTDGAGAAVAVGGSFPLAGSMMNIVNGTGSLGEVKVSSRTLVGGDETTPVEIDQGQKNVDIAKFRLQEVSGSEDVELMNLELQNNGSASEGDYSNIRLVDQDNQVIATVDKVVNNIAKFSILSMTGAKAGARGGFKIPQGQSREFTVRVDASANTNSAGRTMNFTIQNNFRLRAVGAETGVGVTVNAENTVTDDFPIGDAGGNQNWVKFRAGSLTVSRSTESLSGKIAKGASNVALASFDLRAFGEDVEIQEAQFVVLNQNGTGLANGSKTLNGTLKIVNGAGQTVYSETASNNSIYGGTCTTTGNTVASGPCGGAAGTSMRVLSSFFTVPGGSTSKLVFVSDVDQNATSADGYQVRLQAIKFRKASSNTFATLNSLNIDGNTLTVEDSSLTVNKSSSFNPTNLVKGGALQKLGSFDLQAGAAEGQRVNAIKLKICENDASAITSIATHCDAATNADIDDVTTISLKSGDMALGTPATITTNAGGTVSVNFEVPANTTKVVDVYGIVNSSYVPGYVAVSMEVTSSTGMQSGTTVSKAAVLGQNIAVSSSGTLAIQSLGTDGSINIAKLLRAGETDVALFKFKVLESGNKETLNVGKLYFAVRNARNTFSSYSLVKENGEVVGMPNTAIIPLGGNTGEVRFGSLNLSVPKGAEVNMIVRGSVVDAGTLPTNLSEKNVLITPTFTEYTGATSGQTKRLSGGFLRASGATAAATAAYVTGGTFTYATGDFLAVNDIVNFQNSTASDVQAVRIDSDADGDYSDNNTTKTGFNDSATYYVCSVDATNNTVVLQNHNACAGANITAAARANFDAATITITAVNSATYTVMVNGVSASYIADGSATTAEISAGLTAALNADKSIAAVVTAADGAGSVTLTPVVSGTFYALNLGANLASTYTGLATNAVVTPWAFNSLNTNVQEVEPMIVGLQAGNATRVANSEVAVFRITNQGAKSMRVKKLRFEVSGSYEGTTYGPKNFRLGRADEETGAMTSNDIGVAITPKLVAGTCNAGCTLGSAIPATSIPSSGSVIEFDITGAGLTEDIGAGNRKAYMVFADVTGIKDDSTNGTQASMQLRMIGTRGLTSTAVIGNGAFVGGFTDGLVYTYSRTADTVDVGDLVISDSYPVAGKTVEFK